MPGHPVRALVTLAALTGTLLLAATACGDSKQADDGRLSVVTSTTILADWAARVGGDAVAVRSVVPRNADVHSYVPSPGAVEHIARANIVFLVGESFESSFEDTVVSNARGRIVELSQGLDLRPFPSGLAHSEIDDHGHLDPHFYLDADLAIAAIGHIADALGDADPPNRATYQANAVTYADELRLLDREIADRLGALPANRRNLVTFHDAYGYFAARYGLELLGFVVEGPEEQPSAARIAELIDEIRARGVKYVFTEPQFDSRVIEQLARDAGAEVRKLPSDALADAYPDYVSFMRAIADGIAR